MANTDQNLIMRFEEGEIVVAVLHTPREKLLGILGEVSAAGITIRSIDLSYFDDWCRAISEGEAILGMTDNFFPMWRVERMSRDAGVDGGSSMAEEFERWTGRRLADQ